MVTRCTPGPYPSDLSRVELLRGIRQWFLAYTFSSLLAEPGPSDSADPSRTLSGLLPASPAFPGSACPQLHRAAATVRRQGSFHPRSISSRLVAHVKSARGEVSVLSTGPFPQAASRTRRARFRAPGAPQAVLVSVYFSHPMAGHGVGMTAPRYRYRVVLTLAGLNSDRSSEAGHHPSTQ